MAGDLAGTRASAGLRRACRSSRPPTAQGGLSPSLRGSLHARLPPSEALIKLGAREEHIGPAPPHTVQAEGSPIVREDEQADENILSNAVQRRPDRGGGSVANRLEAEMAAESQNLVHVLGRSEGGVCTHSFDCLQVANCQKCREFLERGSEGPAEPARPFEVCPCPVVLRHALVPEMKLNNLIAGQKRGPVGKRHCVVQPAQ